LETVIEENIGKARPDNGAKTEVFQCPRRVLTRRAAAEVITHQQHRSTLVARLVEHEIRIKRALGVIHARLAVIEIAPFIEGIGAKARTLDRLQELLGNNRIGVDVGTIQRRDQTLELRKFIHWKPRLTSLNITRTSPGQTQRAHAR